MTFISFDYQTKMGDFDKESSTRMAERFDLKHKILPISEPSDMQKLIYQVRTGYCGHWGKVKDFDIACAGLDRNATLIMGFAGEIGRAYFLFKNKSYISAARPDKMLKYLHINPDSNHFQAEILKWYNEVSEFDPVLQMDLFYIENRMGCWASPHLYGAAPFRAYIIPFCHREIFNNMLRIHVNYRIKQKLPLDIANLFWPELNEFPFNPEKTTEKKLLEMMFNTLKSAWDWIRHRSN